MFVPSSLWLALDYFTYFFSYGIFLPYWGAWLKGEGHDVATVGMLLSVGWWRVLSAACLLHRCLKIRHG